MGALRAAELAPFGMEGVGEIFAAYCDGTFEDDDEVAVIHCPAELGWKPLSEAMVNIRRTLAEAQRADVIKRSTHIALLAIAKATYYAERSYPALIDYGRRAGISEQELSALHVWLPECLSGNILNSSNHL
jgi:hypothetical protein